jgi:hypothetical protein
MRDDDGGDLAADEGGGCDAHQRAGALSGWRRRPRWHWLAPAPGRPARTPPTTSLNNLGGRFWELGRPADALPRAEEAVASYRELAAASPDRYRSDLVQSLSNLADVLSEISRDAEAGDVRAEAIRLWGG